MADADNLDNLSNAELRAQMLAQGLPNIPVTDSSRKVLVKRLRASLSGNATLPASSPKKASGRRETLQPVAAVAPAQVDKPDGAQAAAKSRRTIASTPSDTKEDERRRQPATKKPENVLEANVSSKPVAAVAGKAAPIQRRISNTERREQLAERVVRKPEPIAEEPPAPGKPQRRESEKTLLVDSLIVLESDEEEDEQLARAAQNAENLYSKKKETVKPKLTTSSINTHEYVTKPLYPSLDQQRLRQNYEPAPMSSQPRSTLGSSSALAGRSSAVDGSSSAMGGRNSALGGSSSSYDYLPASGRYSSYISSPPQSYASPPVTAAATAGYAGSSLRRSPPRTFSNEFSDDTADEDGAQPVKFESDFARNLARLRAERIGDRSSPFRRTTAGGGSTITGGRRSLRQDQRGSTSAVARLWHSLDTKYNLKPKLFILIVVLILFVVYRFFY